MGSELELGRYKTRYLARERLQWYLCIEVRKSERQAHRRVAGHVLNVDIVSPLGRLHPL